MNSLIQFKQTTPVFLVVFALVCFGLFAQMRAAPQVVPPPDGCYPNFTTAEGCDALNLLTTGAGNTGLGWRSLFLNSTGNFNTGVGGGALALNNADSNTAVGAAALLLNTTGTENTATGTDALVHNDSGTENTANGAFALFSNTTGSNNTATGDSALSNNTEGDFNTAMGESALRDNTIGVANTATGYQALMVFNGSGNTANGYQALLNHMTGNDNVAIGALALRDNTIGGGNIALGTSAGANIVGDSNIDIGNAGIAADSHTTRIGDISQTRTFIGGIRGVTTGMANAIPVLIDSQGQLGTMSSSRRFKHEIQRMDNASEAIHALKPVTFYYKSDASGTPQFGLIAEEVAEVNPDLVVRDEKGEIYTVRYDAVNAMLLNEFLKEHRKVEEQQATITELKKDFGATIVQLIARLDEQATQIQKVSAQLEASKPAPQMVINP